MENLTDEELIELQHQALQIEDYEMAETIERILNKKAGY